MFDYLQDVYKFYFNYPVYKQEHQHVAHKILINKQPQKDEPHFKKNDGYKNINSNRILDVIFNQLDV